jgi:predicted esterase
MAALADFETHFNVDRRRVILGGYSSGGDLAYRTGFRNSSTFAGLLIENSSPFRDTGSNAAESLGAATTKFHIVHLAHEGDGTYPLPGVEAETNEVKAAGFPLQLIKRPGGHSDATTDPDLRELLLPHIDDGWLAPAP